MSGPSRSMITGISGKRFAKPSTPPSKQAAVGGNKMGTRVFDATAGFILGAALAFVVTFSYLYNGQPIIIGNGNKITVEK